MERRFERSLPLSEARDGSTPAGGWGKNVWRYLWRRGKSEGIERPETNKRGLQVESISSQRPYHLRDLLSGIKGKSKTKWKGGKGSTEGGSGQISPSSQRSARGEIIPRSSEGRWRKCWWGKKEGRGDAKKKRKTIGIILSSVGSPG